MKKIFVKSFYSTSVCMVNESITHFKKRDANQVVEINRAKFLPMTKFSK